MTESLIGNEDQRFDENKNWLEELVGEGKKFKTQEDLAKGKAYSDHYISTLERERDEIRNDYLKMKEEYNSGLKLQEIIDRLEKAQSSRDNTDDSNDDDNRPPRKDFDPAIIESLVSTKIQEAEASRREQDNYSKVLGKVREKLGESYKVSLKSQADRLGLTDKEVDEMARKKPELFFKTFDLDDRKSQDKFQTPPNSSFRSPNSNNTTARKKSYYEELRKKDLAAYLDPKTLVQMEKDVQAIGWDAFNDV